MTDVTAKRGITLPLLRKRSEHNCGLVSTLEELALHQEELQCIGSTLGRTCGKTLKILLLQNNVIERLEAGELKYFKVLEYLNLALNNVTAIEGLRGMESLKKLDLTLNFIGIESLEGSVDELAECGGLEELFLIGNPCMGVGDGGEAETAVKNGAGWSGCRPYVIARLVNLKYLDGQEVKRSERIAALQKLPTLIEELRTLAAIRIKEQQNNRSEVAVNDEIDDVAPTHHNPETRTKLSNEMYEQKRSKEKQESAHVVKQKGEKEWEEEQRATVGKVREREEQDCGSNELKPNGEIKQCNQGKYQFYFEESDMTSDKGALIMHIALPKHLSTSLIDVDIHPTYVSVIIKSKLLRVLLPVEVLSDASVARRIVATGVLELVMPKANGDKAVGMQFVCEKMVKDKEAPKTTTETVDSAGGEDVGQKRLGYAIIQEAVTVESVRGIVSQPSIVESDDEDEPPPLW